MKNMKENAGAIVGIIGGIGAIGYGAFKLLTGSSKKPESDEDTDVESEVNEEETTENEDNDDAE